MTLWSIYRVYAGPSPRVRERVARDLTREEAFARIKRMNDNAAQNKAWWDWAWFEAVEQ